MLQITKQREADALTVQIAGRLDTTTAPELERALHDELPEATALSLDMTELEYISSAGLRVLLSTQKIMNRQGTMKLTGVNETIMEIFEITGFCDILTIE